MRALQHAAGWAVVAAIGVIALAACESGTGTSAAADSLLPQKVPARVTVTTATLAGLGRILVDGTGHALYMFPPDAGSRVSCVGACAGIWPPLVLASGHQVRAGAHVNGEDLGTLADPNTGARIVTYAGYPLYRYAGDVRPHEANGQALFNNGGPWYVLDVDGQPITTDPADSR